MKTFALLIAVLGLVACGGDDTSSAKPSCEAIVEACHPKDPGSGPVHDCHENAESVTSTEADCAAAKDACVGLCEAAPLPADAGTTTADAAMADAAP
jgi:hypothetical protein